MAAQSEPVPLLGNAAGGQPSNVTVGDEAITSLRDDLLARLSEAAARHDDVSASLDDVAASLEELAGKIHSHEHHHACDLNDFIQGVRRVLDELSTGVGGGGELSGAVRGVRQIRAHLRRLDDRVDRLTRAQSESATTTSTTPVAAQPEPTRTGPLHQAGRVGQLFDYTGFERHFRGAADHVRAQQVERYADLVSGSPGLVVDIGCGRGEFLQSLLDRGIDVQGVEPDDDMADAAETVGVPVRRCTATQYLESVADRSLGAIISLQVVEHLPFEDVLAMAHLAAVKLMPGGLFVAETPNPASWIVMHSSFILDPTHRWPVHPALLAFICTSAGLDEVEVRYYAEADTLHLPQVSSTADPALAEQVNQAFAQLNHHLYGPQDYAVVARAPRSS